MGKDVTNTNTKWIETGEEGHTLLYEAVVGNSGVYLVVTDLTTAEILRDDRPWQMREGQS